MVDLVSNSPFIAFLIALFLQLFYPDTNNGWDTYKIEIYLREFVIRYYLYLSRNYRTYTYCITVVYNGKQIKAKKKSLTRQDFLEPLIYLPILKRIYDEQNPSSSLKMKCE